MRFNREKWPVLWALSEKLTFQKALSLGVVEIPVDADEEGFEGFEDFFNYLSESRRNDIFITEPIRKLVDEDLSMSPILEKQVLSGDFDPTFMGTVSWIPPLSKEPTTILIQITPKGHWPLIKENVVCMATFLGNKFTTYVVARDLTKAIDVIASTLRKDDPMSQVMGQAISTTYMFIKQILYFMDHCDEKEKYVLNKLKKRVKTQKAKYTTDFPNPKIQVIDSTYFTTTVSGAFKVRAHWRLQPCGKNFADRKFIRIKEFEKKGVKRRAKINK